MSLTNYKTEQQNYKSKYRTEHGNLKGCSGQFKQHIINKLKQADRSLKTNDLINRINVKKFDEHMYDLIRELIRSDSQNRPENVIKAHDKRLALDKKKTDETEHRFKKIITENKMQQVEQQITKGQKKLAETEKQFKSVHNSVNKRKKQKVYDVKVKVKFIDHAKGPHVQWRTIHITLTSKYHLVHGKLDQRDMETVNKEVMGRFDAYNVEILKILFIHLREIVTDKKFKNIKNKQKSIAYRFLEELNGQMPEQFYEDNLCVIRFIVNSLTGVRQFSNITIPSVKSQFEELKIDFSNGVSVESMIHWIKTYYPKIISLFAIDPCYNVFKSYVAERAEHTLMFIVNNGHVYPVYNDAIKKRVAQSKTIETGKVTWFVEGTNYKLMQKKNISQSPLDEGVDQGDNKQYEEFLKGENQDKNEVILFEQSLETIATDIIKTAGYSVTAMKFRNSEIEAFQHPLTGQIIQHAPDYHLRERVCKKFYELHPLNCFEFKNQSFNTLASSLFEVIHGKINKSCHIKEDQQIIDEYHTSPLIETLVEDFQFNENCKGFDIKKSYANAMINMDCDYPIFSICDSFEKYTGQDIEIGEYVLDECVIEQLGGIKIHKQVYGYNLVSFLLSKSYIDKSKILFFKKASFNLSSEIFSEFLQTIRDLFPEDDNIFKALSVCFIGGLGQRFRTSDQCFITDDWETVCASFVDHKKENNAWSVQSLEDLHFVKISNKKRLFEEHSQIFRQVVSQGIIQLLELAHTVYNPITSKIIGYNTDALFIYNPNDIDFKEYPQYKPEAWKPKKYKVFEQSTFQINIPEMVWNKLDEKQTDIKDLSFVCNGGGGCGKTTTLVQCNTPDTSVLSSTNKACDNIRQKGVKNVNTFNSYFYQAERISNKTKKIQIDEYSMMTHHWLKTIYKIHMDRPDLITQMFGDKNQCKPVCSSGRFFDYLEKRAFHSICGGNLLVKEYIPNSARYDAELNQVVNYLLKTGKMHPKLKKQHINPGLQTNIVYCNALRDKINKKFAKKFFVGQKVIAETNQKEKGLFKSKFYYISELLYKQKKNKKTNEIERVLHKIKVSENPEGENIDEEGFSVKHFRATYAVTVFKYQGSTIDEPYNIHDTHMMSRNELYTALTRGTKLSDVHIEFSKRIFQTATEPEYSTLAKPEEPIFGFIYEMSNKKHDVYYIGQTKKSVEHRFQTHKDNLADTMHKYDGEWEIKQLTKLHFFDKKKLLDIERLYTLKYQLEGKTVTNETNLLKKDVEVQLNTKVVAGKYDEKLLEKFNIQEVGGAFRIRYRQGGRQYELRRRFNESNKEQKYKEIQEEQNKLILSFN